ncbi:MAG: YidC/Oxa1 family membrane protein insertase [Candidatus Parcubacteria bacterium]|nr:YidC/Oxa1 family membrane protein insertase [Candidatus Parcubacteria bacterium]
MSFLYHEFLFRPLFNLLIFLYNIIPGGDFGLAIILLTLIVRFIFFPLSIKALVSQKELGKLQPKIKELQDKYKNDKQALGKATMELYKEHKVNPFGGCLPILVQLPVLIALYSALGSGLKPESFSALYSFIDNPGAIKQIAFGFIDLTHKSPYLAILAGVMQWFQSKQAAKLQGPVDKNSPPTAAFQMNKQMLYFFPIMVIIIAWNLPTGLVIYWVAATVFSIFEQLYINRKYR